MQHKIYAYISDGGVEEEISQGTGRIAGILGLNNLIMFYDSNDIQLSTECKVVMQEDTAAKYKAWGWNVVTINGNDPDEIRKALADAQKEEKRPTLIIGKTVMGKGALRADGTSYEHCINTHGAPLGGDAYINTIKNLGGNPDEPFVIFPEVQKLYADRREELKGIVAAWPNNPSSIRTTMDIKTVGIACDHAGFPLKKFVLQYLESHGYAYKDYGTYSDLSCDYPDFGHALAEGVESGEVYPGIGICGSGEGISMTLNKHQGIRAGLAWIPEIAHLIRQHNDANVLVLPGRFIDNNTAEAILDEFFKTSFEGGRHQLRIDKIPLKQQ